MKNYIYIIISLLVLSGCSDSFLETENKNTLDMSSYFKTENDLRLAVNTAYTPIGHFGMFGLNYVQKMNELDPYIQDEKNTLDQMVMGVSEFSGSWDALYVGLYRTCDIIHYMDLKLKDVVEPTKFNQYKAQVKALRGMYYFYLVTMFNQPIFYDENSLPSNPLVTLKNGTHEEVWSKLEEDLTYAGSMLPDSWPSTETGRITKGAANAMLGKALLYKHYHYYLRFAKSDSETKANLLKAKQALKLVIDGGKYSLVMPKAQTKADYQAALLSNSSFLDMKVGNNIYKSENNSESVWEIQYNNDTRGAESNGYLPLWQSGGNNLAMFFGPLGYKNQFILPDLWNKFESSGAPVGYNRDPRAYATCFIDGDSLDWRNNDPASSIVLENKLFNSDKHISGKALSYNTYTGSNPQTKAFGLKKYYYTQYNTNNSDPVNFRLIRYADVLLMYAEVTFQYNNDIDGDGLTALNQVRERAGMPVKTALDPTIIINEFCYEFATEAHRYSDIIRWSFDKNFPIDLTELFNGNFKSPKHLYFPIPQAEIDANKGSVSQNPGW